MVKTERLAVKVLPAHKMAIESMAKADGEPVVIIVRRLIRGAAKQRGFWPVKEGQPQEVRHA